MLLDAGDQRSEVAAADAGGRGVAPSNILTLPGFVMAAEAMMMMMMMMMMTILMMTRR